MLKKLLYLYNDGHNPFPHLRGKGLHLIDDKYEYDNKPDDTQVYDGGFITGNYVPVGDDKFRITDEYGNVMDVDRDKPIEPPDYYEKLTSQVDYALEDDDDRFGNEKDDDDEILESINEEIEKNNNIASEIVGESKGGTVEKLQEAVDNIYKRMEGAKEQHQNITSELVKLVNKATKSKKSELERAFIDLGKHPLFKQITGKVVEDFLKKDNLHDFLISEIKDKIIKFSKLLQTTPEKYANALAYNFHKSIPQVKGNENTVKTFTQLAGMTVLVFTQDDEKYDNLKKELKKVDTQFDKDHEKNLMFMEQLDKYNDLVDKNSILEKQYAERKKVLDQKKRLSEIKELYKTNPEQAAKDALELNAELKEKEALAQGKQLSKAAQKKANSAAKKAAAEKQAEAPVVNAQASLKSTGTYGKKLETFFTGGGQPILQKFTGDSSKIHDIEKQEIIPDELVTFDDKTTNSLRKACTLDLYNNKFVFEIKNYVNNSIDDDVIPMQPSKFAGTKYFVPTYLENGRLFSLNLNYDSPKTGIKHRENILPPNPQGYEVVFIIRLKEGLFQYKPFLDKENNKLIPNGEFASGKRPLYFFDETKLKKCLDYNKKPAFNLKGHLDPI
jgi:hypothetical protein